MTEQNKDVLESSEAQKIKAEFESQNSKQKVAPLIVPLRQIIESCGIEFI